MEYATRTTTLDKFYQESKACAENVVPKEKERLEIAIVVDDIASEIGSLRIKLGDLRDRIGPILVVGKEGVEVAGYKSPGYGSELGERLGQLLAAERDLCAFVDTLIRELAI